MVLGVGFKMLAFPLYTSYMCDIRKGRQRTCHWEPSKDHDGYNLSFRVCVWRRRLRRCFREAVESHTLAHHGTEETHNSIMPLHDAPRTRRLGYGKVRVNGFGTTAWEFPCLVEGW
jgi:hypothetical protein